jgi:hypothetical protein
MSKYVYSFVKPGVVFGLNKVMGKPNAFLNQVGSFLQEYPVYFNQVTWVFCLFQPSDVGSSVCFNQVMWVVLFV